jgi:hypothetical protein
MRDAAAALDPCVPTTGNLGNYQQSKEHDSQPHATFCLRIRGIHLSVASNPKFHSDTIKEKM